ncbi:alpha/beta hydrolase [Paenibacillus physcomitrellae]|uniref:Tributyrin esterase n=1 Tax=Paenibacillus physcomitrellae TaxID=1619311 RepID=A0ABQ1GCW6_9BACL|nr:alpha/beta hydrolase family protein [Paenibacillus physcomitrellae]GGA41194.1 tributyrin esterase [Paenibacillus physcomitrellae]
MPFIQTSLFSETLGMPTEINVVIPHLPDGDIRNKAKLPVLYLLHGLGGDHKEWTRQSSIERYAESKGVALVMPRADRSYYTDMKQGGAYFTYLSEELPELVSYLFPLSRRREDTFVAGISMGGYGAFKLALRCPERYAAAASLSGALDIVGRVNGPNGFQPGEAERIFGDPGRLQGSGDDLLALLPKAAKSGFLPRLYQCCGTEDFLYEGNRIFLRHAEQAGLKVAYEESPGEHEWGYWDRQARRMMEWLPCR